MGITRRNRGPMQADKENAAKFNRESRPWDNQASYSKLPKLSAPIPIRPPRPRSPTTERFVPLLRSTKTNVQNPTSPRRPTPKTSPVPMSVSPRRKADHLSSSPPFTRVDTEAFQTPAPDVSAGIANRRDLFESNADMSPPVLSVSDRMRMFEQIDESARERPSPHLLRNSPFKGALDAFVVGAPDDLDFSYSSKSATSSEKDHVSNPTPVVQLKTKFGNREVTPLLTTPKPPPLVGLPIPKVEKKVEQKEQPQPIVDEQVRDAHDKRRSRLSVRLSKFVPLSVFEDGRGSSSQATSESEEYDELSCEPSESESSGDLFEDLDVDSLENKETRSKDAPNEVELPNIPDAPPPPAPATSKMSPEDPDLMPRFSYRHSMRVPRASMPVCNDNVDHSARSSFRHSKRLGDREKSDLNFLPKSSSFLDFDDDSRLTPLESSEHGGGNNGATAQVPSAWTDMSFDEPDSFDTFATLPKDLKPARELKASIPAPANGDAERPGSDESEKPLFPVMSFSKKNGPQRQEVEDDDDGTLDVPNRFTRRPGAEKALRDLQRASVTAGNEISANLRKMSNAHDKVERATTKEDKISRVQGDVLLRSRIFRRWNLRYASIVHQGYFGKVLLLFRPDSKGGISPTGTFALKSSKMIALAESSVKKVDNSRKAGSDFMFELKTSQRTYTFACNNEEGRDFWVKNLSSA